MKESLREAIYKIPAVKALVDGGHNLTEAGRPDRARIGGKIPVG